MGKQKVYAYLYERQDEKLEMLVEEGYFDNKSEAVRTILNLKLDEAVEEIRG